MTGFQIATLSDIEAIEKTPIEERVPAHNTYDLIRHGAALDPEAVALSFMLSGEAYASPLQITYRELIANITRTANLFHALGIGPNDVVSYLLPNLPQTHYTLWGGEAAGIVNPINPMLEAGTIRDICRAAGTKVLVALGDVPGADIWPKVAAIRHELPDLQTVVRVFGPSEEKEGILGFDEVIGRYNGTHLDSGRRIQPQDRASLYHTGGTTGTPKLAPHTHFNEVAMAFMMDAACDLKTGEAILCGLPLFHVNGATVTGSFPFSIGAHVVLISPRGYRDPSAIRYFYKIVDHYKAVSFSSVPTVLSTLLEIPLEGADISSLRYGICGAAPLSTELFTRFEAHSGMKILEGYGLTEGTCASSLNPLFGERRVGSIGMRLPYQQMKVMVPEEGAWRDAAPDEIGAICIKGPNVFAGYLEASRNADLWPEEGWLNSGDLGRQDRDGYFWLTGRTKELIIRGGHNIDPAMIEDPLYRLPEVQVAAAVGRPDAHAGEVPVAYVQLAAGASTTGAELLEYLTRTVGERAAVPKSVEIVDVIPLTPVGKIFKPALRWQAIRKVYLEELAALGATARRVEVQVGEDKKHGALARIRIEADADADRHQLADAVKALLARYTVRYELEIVSPAAGPENR